MIKKGTRSQRNIIAVDSNAVNGKEVGVAFSAMGFIAANVCSTTIAGNEGHANNRN